MRAEKDRDLLLLSYLAVAMVGAGQPTHEVSHDIRELGRHLGYAEVRLAATPTAVSLALGPGQPAALETLAGPLRLDQIGEVRRLRHQLLSDEVDPRTALAQLNELRSRPAPYPKWLSLPAWVLTAVGIGLVLQPGWANLICTAIGSVIVLGLVRLSAKNQAMTILLPCCAAFVVTALIFIAADAGLVEAPLRTILAPLAILLPGAALVTGLSEIAAGAMVSGVSRVGYGATHLLLCVFGVVAAVGLLKVPASQLGNVRVDQLGWWATPAGLIAIGVGICLLEGIRLGWMPWVMVVLVSAATAQVAGQHFWGIVVGAFLGAVAASLVSAIVEMVRPPLPRLVIFLPAFWMLVPGSFGLLSATERAVGATQESALISLIQVAGALAIGLLVGSVIADSLRAVRAIRPPRMWGH